MVQTIPTRWRAALVAASLALPAAAQTATYSWFGAPGTVGCSPVGPAIVHSVVAPPRLGATFTAQVPVSTGDCGYLCHLSLFATGLSEASFGGSPLPIAVGPSNCGALRVSLDRIEWMPFGGLGATAPSTLAIPSTPSLVGFEFFQQPFTMTFVLGGLQAISFGRAGRGVVGY